LTLDNPKDLDQLQQGDVIRIDHLRDQLAAGTRIMATVNDHQTITLRHELSTRQQAIFSSGGVINWLLRRTGS
jgi:aconitate hydratase